MSAPRKPTKAERLKDSLNQGEPAAQQVDRSGYQESSQSTVSFRIDTADRQAIERFAKDRGLKVAQLVRLWVLERAAQERIR